jgi:exonuclease SbcC
MRILAIRGCNLASLGGEFEIDLARGPLSEAGVFAIVGPTGAGKSTLLDAMCVALFDRTPRLANRSTVQVGKGEDDPAALGAQDVRMLLRRGASAGWAEVDFESGDLQRYRARWSVRRARGATDGNLQDQQISLVALAGGGERLGGTKTETLKAIHQRLGLTFDQFRRSALLAQGDFATFLRAEGKDRSELLERMTGTEIYSKLSVAAHLRATLAEQQLRERHGAALAIAVLSDAARAAAEADLERAGQAREAARTRFARAELVARWRAEAEVRARGVAEAEAEHAAAVRIGSEAEPIRSELALRRRAEALRGVWDEAGRLDRQHSIARGELAAAAASVETARAAHVEVVARRSRIAELHGPIRAARIAAGIVEQDGAPKRTRRATGPEVDLAAAERTGQAALEAALWLSERRALAPEIAAWPAIDAKLEQYRALGEAIAAADRTLADHAARRELVAAKQVAVTAQRDAAKDKLAEAAGDAERFVARRTLSLDAAGRAEDQARARCAEVERLVAIAAGARAAAAARAELDTQLAELEQLAAADRDRRTAAVRERDAAEVLRDERARVIAELRRAAGYEHVRTELVDGEPCPLCGAEQHPWKEQGAFDTLIGDAECAHAVAASKWDVAVAQIAQLAARATQRDGERARLASSRATVEASTETSGRAWREQLAALGELVLAADPATPDAERLAAERAQLAHERLEAARTARSEAVAAAKAVADAQARVQVCQANLDQHLGQLRELGAELASLAAAVERIGGERGGRVERHAELAAELDAQLARWLAAVPEPDRARLGFAGSVPPKRGRSKRATADLQLAATIDRDALRALAAEWRTRAETVATADAALAAALAAVDRAATAAERAVAEAAARHAEHGKRASELAAQLVIATTAVDDARIAAGFDRDTLQRLLAGDPAHVDALAAQLDAFDRAVDRATTRVAERRRLAADHAAQRPPDGEDAGAPPSVGTPINLEALAAAVTAADHDAAALAAMLAADGDARRRRDAALATFAAAERAAEIDRVLGEVIGSHDGKLFRSFAQSLTLDGLLAVANAHLEELAPRYQLERVPKHDLELQVIDRDFGGEVRSVQSLSGGESFLVSLALALGLSSMSAQDVRVRTLLIDEGFGTLDPATLDSALAVLDELQATGRQVGVISHVPALLDRVRAHVRVSPRGGGRSEVVVPPS